MKVRVHVKNNRWAEGSFPNTPEGEDVFSITDARIRAAIAPHENVSAAVDFTVDWDTDNFLQSMRTAEVLLAWNFPTQDLAKVAPNLRWIHIIASGVEHLTPMTWVPPGVVVTNNKGVHAAKAGEFGLMAVLMLHSRIPAIVTNQRSATFASLYSSPIAGRTVVVIGTGSLGGSVARRLAPFGVKVIGVNRRGHPVEGIERVVSTAQIEAVLPEADYVVSAAPETPETRGLLNRTRLKLLKRSAGIINMGRQSIMDYTALCDMLNNEEIGGAILDVFDPEPIAGNDQIWRTRNLIITPHVSADDGDAYVPMTLDLFIQNMKLYLAGQPLLNPVDQSHGY